MAVGGVAWACLRRPDCLLESVDQGVDWMDRFQHGGSWRVRVRLRCQAVEAGAIELRFDMLELRDAAERRLDLRRPEPIPLDPVPSGEVVERWVTMPAPSSARRIAPGEVRRLRIAGSVRAVRGWRLSRSRPFDLDMDQDGSFIGRLQIRRVA